MYFNAANDRIKNKDVPKSLRTDYVYKKRDVRYFKEQMYLQTEIFHKERMENEDLVPPPDQTEVDVEVIKDQILTLNDKFDYLLYVMMKNQKLGHEVSSSDFTVDESKIKQISIDELEREHNFTLQRSPTKITKEGKEVVVTKDGKALSKEEEE
jgi:hypothetical protein